MVSRLPRVRIPDDIDKVRSGHVDIADFRTSERSQERYRKIPRGTERFQKGTERTVSENPPPDFIDFAQKVIKATVFTRSDKKRMQETFFGFSSFHENTKAGRERMRQEALAGVLEASNVAYTEDVKIEIRDEAFLWFTTRQPEVERQEFIQEFK